MSVPELRFKQDDGRDFPEWGIAPLGAVSQFLDGKRKPIKESDRAKIKGIYPYYGASGIIDHVNDYIFDEDIILLGEDGENIVSRNLPLAFKVSGKCWVNNHAHVIKPNKSTNIDFLTQYLDSISYLEYNTGTAQPKLNQEICKKIPVPIPHINEQTKIANFLTNVDEKISLLTQKYDLLTQYKKGVMQQIFSQELRFKDADGGDFPEWEERALGDLGEIVTGKTPSTSDENLWGGDIQFVTPTDINEDKYQFETSRTVVNHSKLRVLPKNSIMFTCIASIGKMSLSTKPCITNQQINSLIPKPMYNSEYVYYALLEITNFIKSTQSSSTLPIINKTEFSKFIIPVPSSAEQTKIANFLTAIDDKITATRTQLQAVKQYKQGLLQQMFV